MNKSFNKDKSIKKKTMVNLNDSFSKKADKSFDSDSKHDTPSKFKPKFSLTDRKPKDKLFDSPSKDE